MNESIASLRDLWLHEPSLGSDAKRHLQKHTTGREQQSQRKKCAIIGRATYIAQCRLTTCAIMFANCQTGAQAYELQSYYLDSMRERASQGNFLVPTRSPRTPAPCLW